MEFKDTSSEPIKLLDEEDRSYIGRKKSVHKQHGQEGTMLLGRSLEKENYGKRIYLDALSPHVIFISGARGSGKCLTGNTEIQLSDGRIVKIKDLKKEESKILSLNSNLKIEESKKIGFYERQVNQILKLKLRSGREIELTPEHPLLTINGWIPANLLKEKDRIATPRNLPCFGKNKMKNKEVKLLAYLLAEGHLKNRFVLFSNADEKIVKEFKKDVKSFDKNLQILEHGKGGCYRISRIEKSYDPSKAKRNKKGQYLKGTSIGQKSSIMKWLIKLGLYGKLAKQRELPEEILTLNKQQLKLFLNRLFSCDGSIYTKSGYWQIDYSTASEKLAKQVQNLLLRFGVLSKIRKRKTKLNNKTFDAYELVVDSENVVKFIKEIGFFGEKEEKQRKALKEISKKKLNPNVDTIPKGIWKIHKFNWMKTARILGYVEKSFHNSKNYCPSREKLLKIAKATKNKELKKIADSDIFWDEIKSIEKINKKTKVYDISVPKNHNFIANNIIVHNSYALAVIAEELTMKNPNIASVIIDPIGIFWSMRYPNKEKKELSTLGEWGLEPQGIDNTRIFIPKGMGKKVPKETYDNLFSLKPNELNADDWCLTFGIERFSPSGLLLEKAIEKTKEKNNNYSLKELIKTIEKDPELSSKEKGYKTDSRRALISRLEAAKSWGVLSKDGTSLAEVCKPGVISIIDISFLDENVASLVIGMLSKKILAARKLVTRQQSMEKYVEIENLEDVMETNIPPTWLFIDEAHTLIPSGGSKTAATNSLIEYVKQGRRPGCSLVFATQQPSAINTKVLSQLDLLLCHKLVFDEDLKAVLKRMPTSIPKEYTKSNFIKKLPIGVCLLGDRSDETSRAFTMQIRPRLSQHEGRETYSIKTKEKTDPKQIEKLLVDLIYKKMQATGRISLSKTEDIIDTITSRYSIKIKSDEVVQKILKKHECLLEEGHLVIPNFEQEKEIEEAGIPALKANISESTAEEIAERQRKRKKLGLFGKEEVLKSLELIYEPIYKLKIEIKKPNGIIPRTIYINNDYELFYNDRGLKKTKGMNEIVELTDKKVKVLKALEKTHDAKKVAKITKLTGQAVGKHLNDLIKENLVRKKDDAYLLNKRLVIPDTLDNKKYSVELQETKPQRINIEEYEVNENLIKKIPTLFDKAKVKSIEKLLKPIWKATYEADETRIQKFDAL